MDSPLFRQNQSNYTSDDSFYRTYSCEIFLRYISAFFFIAYFISAFLLKELKRNSMVYIHHTNLISFLFNLHYILYFEIDNLSENETFCKFSEVFWALSKLISAYSVGLIAVFRIIAVFDLEFYKKLISKKIYLIVPLIIIYVLCSLIFIGSKFGFKTTHGFLYCTDGHSSNLTDSIAYYLVQIFIGILLPTGLVIGAYFVIINKLSLTTQMTNVNEKRLMKQRFLAKQFLLINTCEIISSFFMIILGLRAILPGEIIINDEKRFIFRMLTLMIQSLMPVITISFTHSVQKIVNFKKLRQKFSNKTEYNNKMELETFDRTKTLNNQSL